MRKLADRAAVEIPAGVELPDGRVLTFRPSRACDCADCAAAFRALERGTLTLPEEVECLWVA